MITLVLIAIHKVQKKKVTTQLILQLKDDLKFNKNMIKTFFIVIPISINIF